MASFSSQLSLLIGLGVGVDYALFIVTRYRQGLQRGKSVEDAIVDSVDTSGRAVMFAGMTVCIALLGMFALGVSFLYGVAIAASVVVAFTVLAALTLLPATLGFFGVRVLGRKARRALAAGQLTTSDSGGWWERWTNFMRARPALIATAAVLVMAVIAIPFFSMRLGSSDAGSDPTSSTTRQAYDLLAKGFGPGYNGPLQLVAQVGGPGQQAAFAKVTTAVADTKGVVRVTPPVTIPGHDGAPGVATANVYPIGSPQAASTSDLLSTLRTQVVPKASAGTGVHVLIGGQTAIFADFSSVLSSKLPLFIGVVVLLSFLLLAAVFRSLVIPATAALMNLLSAGAAFGVITAVFQFGWFSSLLGVNSTGPIEAFIPVMMFAILFGLSMDYEVFLVTRIYEEWNKTHDNRLAVARGLASTGSTITAAATIMVLVFASFILGGQVIIEMFGLGLAAAVLLDALIVRSIIVPGVMLILGKANWWLPRSLDRLLPHLNVEGDVNDDQPPQPAPPEAPRDLIPAPSAA
jgi:RND superfamily putative drug exporter